ncbi:hypothetical protein ABW19_dt0206527 [Dactylella cylindrospora]|nr:hypothetical protein ABW19_dt0206527 [Dactylella cylindrospora]
MGCSRRNPHVLITVRQRRGGPVGGICPSPCSELRDQIAFSPDSTVLAVPDIPTIRIWDVTSKYAKVAYRTRQFEKALFFISFMPNSDPPTPTHEDGIIGLSNMTTGDFTVLGKCSPGQRGAFSQDGKLLAICTGNEIVRLQEVGGEGYHTSLRGHKTEVQSVKFSLDGNLLLSRSETEIMLWNLKTMRLHITLNGKDISGRNIAFSPDYKLLAAELEDNTISLWDIETGNCCREFKSHLRYVESLSFYPNGKLLMCKDGFSVRFSRAGIESPIGGTTKPGTRAASTQDSWDYWSTQGILTPPWERGEVAYCLWGNVIALGFESGDIAIIKL